MIVLAGASASGKTEVAKMLAAKYGIVKAITTTTRDMRVGESNGRDYFFVSKAQFKDMIEQNRFVEFTTYNDNLYGSTKDQIAPNKCVVVDPAGLKAYIALNNPDIALLLIFKRFVFEHLNRDVFMVIREIENRLHIAFLLAAKTNKSLKILFFKSSLDAVQINRIIKNMVFRNHRACFVIYKFCPLPA